MLPTSWLTFYEELCRTLFWKPKYITSTGYPESTYFVTSSINTGATLPSFQSAGTSPVLNDVLHNSATISEISSDNYSINILEPTESIPGALFIFNLFNLFIIVLTCLIWWIFVNNFKVIAKGIWLSLLLYGHCVEQLETGSWCRPNTRAGEVCFTVGGGTVTLLHSAQMRLAVCQQ